jgi:hypothetical protein
MTAQNRESAAAKPGLLGALTILTVMILAGMVPRFAHAESSGGSGPQIDQQIIHRLDALEQENRELRSEVVQLKRQVAVLPHQSGSMQNSAGGASEAAEYQAHHEIPFQVGFRTGWSESPYEMPGGVFYSAFLNHRLLTQEDGIPYGFVSGELMAGVTLGNHAVTTGNLASALGVVGPASSSLLTLEIEPTVQYHLNMASVGAPKLAAIEPYVLGGPGIWISMMSTPVVNKGSIPGNGFRHQDADLQPGGVVGLGFDLRLGKLAKVDAIQGVLDKTTAGAEWRYNYLGNGQKFNQYTGSVAFGF